MNKASAEMRTWYVAFSAIIWLGIYLTGFDAIHWLLYIPPIGLLFAAVTGICPTQLLVFSFFKKK